MSQAPGASDEPLGQSVDASESASTVVSMPSGCSGSPEQIAQMKAMIAAIDMPRRQRRPRNPVRRAHRAGPEAIGIDFNNANGQIGVVTFAVRRDVRSASARDRRFQRGNAPAHLPARSFQAALYAQIQKGNGRIVSRPRIAAQSGSTAKIITGDALPILTVDRAVGRQRRLAAGSVCERRRDAADRAASKPRRLGLEPRVRSRLERNRVQPGLSDDQPARGRDFGDRARRRFSS